MKDLDEDTLMAIGGFLGFVVLIIFIAVCCRWKVNRARRRQEEALAAYASDKSTKNDSSRLL